MPNFQNLTDSLKLKKWQETNKCIHEKSKHSVY